MLIKSTIRLNNFNDANSIVDLPMARLGNMTCDNKMNSGQGLYSL